MKILQINSVCGIGSTGRIATDIHNILIDKGHESYIAYGRGQSKNCDNTIKIGTEMDNYTHVFKTRLLDKHGFGSKKATIELIEKVKEIDPDVIHLHNLHGYYVNIKILFDYLKEVDKPVIWTLHDCWPFTGHGAYLDNIGNYSGEDVYIYGTTKSSYPKSIICNNAKRNYDNKKKIFTGLKNLTIVTPSQWLANLVNESFLSEYLVKVINNGVDLNVFKPTKSSFKSKYNLQGKFVILGVASIWDSRKGLKYFADLKKSTSEDEKIVLVGLSKKQLKEIPKDIIGISKTDKIEDLVDIYSSADVFVNTTLEDNFPTTNLESLACGRPVITFDTGGSPESIDDTVGIVVEQENVCDLRYAINKIKAQRKNYFEANCIIRSKKLYDKNEKFLEYIDSYKEIAESSV